MWSPCLNLGCYTMEKKKSSVLLNSYILPILYTLPLVVKITHR